MKEFGLSIGLFILRIGFGVLLAVHGWGKLQMLLNGQAENFADPIGIGKQASLILAVFGEFVCAGLVTVGLATRLAAIPAVITMAVAAFVVHAQDPLMMGEGRSKEPALIYLTAFLALVFTGPGLISLDAIFWKKRKQTKQE